jgi:O-antigen biosynthesis protein WbqP
MEMKPAALHLKLPDTKAGYYCRADCVKRGFDIVSGAFLITVFSHVMLCLWGIVRLTSKGKGIYWSNRIGRDNHVFRMPKFRTMREGTPTVATHLLGHPEKWVTPIGKLLRRLSLDEVPQLYSVIRGDMSFVGPRPALYNQFDLIELRTNRGIHRLVPGITGWAQVNGRDELPIPVKVDFDEYYLHNRSFLFDMRILAMTIARILKSSGVSH